MARTGLTDVLQTYAFWLMDVAPIEPLALPVFNPLFGFSGITSPEMTLDLVDIPEGNSYYVKKVVKRGSVSNMTLTQGATFYNSDFWNWTTAALTGNTGGLGSNSVLSAISGAVGALGGPTPRRDLLLVHAFVRNPFGNIAAASVAINAGLAGAVGAILSAGVNDPSAGGATAGGGGTAGIIAALGAGGVAAVGAAAPGPFEFAPRIPARAFLLRGCIPVRYKTGGDYDASSSDVSIKELEIAVEGIEEITLSV